MVRKAKMHRLVMQPVIYYMDNESLARAVIENREGSYFDNLNLLRKLGKLLQTVFERVLTSRHWK